MDLLSVSERSLREIMAKTKDIFQKTQEIFPKSLEIFQKTQEIPQKLNQKSKNSKNRQLELVLVAEKCPKKSLTTTQLSLLQMKIQRLRTTTLNLC